MRSRVGCGDEWDAMDLECNEGPEACERCCSVPSACSCAPCEGCSEVMDSANLTLAVDGRWRCATCSLRADLKLLCAERPAFIMPRGRDLRTDLKRTTEEAIFSMEALVFGMAS